MKILNNNSLNVTENKKIIYGLSQNDLNEVRKKHEKNLNYLKKITHSFSLFPTNKNELLIKLKTNS